MTTACGAECSAAWVFSAASRLCDASNGPGVGRFRRTPSLVPVGDQFAVDEQAELVEQIASVRLAERRLSRLDPAIGERQTVDDVGLLFVGRNLPGRA